MQATHHAFYQPDVAWTLSVDADDLGLKASGKEAQRRTRSTSLSFRAVMVGESGEQSQRSHTADHQLPGRKADPNNLKFLSFVTGKTFLEKKRISMDKG